MSSLYKPRQYIMVSHSPAIYRAVVSDVSRAVIWC